MSKEVRKVKVTRGRTLEVELIEKLEDKSDREVSMKCSQLVHNDLYRAMDKLKVHFVKLCDLFEGKDLTPETFDSEEQLTKFKVTSFSIGGEEESEGVTITGQKELAGGKILNLNTPFTKYSDEMDQYIFASELAADIANCVYEAEQYLFEQKYAIKQLEIDFPDSSLDHEPSDDVDMVNPVMEIKKEKKGKNKEMISPIPPEHEKEELAEVFS
jgi:hypothetical protein